MGDPGKAPVVGAGAINATGSAANLPTQQTPPLAQQQQSAGGASQSAPTAGFTDYLDDDRSLGLSADLLKEPFLVAGVLLTCHVVKRYADSKGDSSLVPLFKISDVVERLAAIAGDGGTLLREYFGNKRSHSYKDFISQLIATGDSVLELEPGHRNIETANNPRLVTASGCFRLLHHGDVWNKLGPSGQRLASAGLVASAQRDGKAQHGVRLDALREFLVRNEGETDDQRHNWLESVSAAMVQHLTTVELDELVTALRRPTLSRT
jgi:hypothetical protein